MMVLRPRHAGGHHLLQLRRADGGAFQMDQVGIDAMLAEYRLDIEPAMRRRLDPVRQRQERDRRVMQRAG
jgi:hypothetical protein